MKVLGIPVLDITGSALSVALGGMLFYTAYLVQTGQPLITKNVPVVAAALLSQITLDPNNISGRAAVVYDPTSGRVLFAKNADETLPLASLTKLMTAQTVLAKKDLATNVYITKQDLAPDGDWGLKPGEVWSLKQLLTFGLVASSNDAMAAAAAAAGPDIVGSMNATAQSLGLSHMYFANPTGLDLDQGTAGAYGSARDVALLAAHFLQTNPELFEQTSHPSVSIQNNTSILTASSTDLPLLDIPGIIAAKTGYTDLAGGNLVAVFDVEVGHPIVVAVLGSTRDGRFDDVRSLVAAVRARPELKN